MRSSSLRLVFMRLEIQPDGNLVLHEGTPLSLILPFFNSLDTCLTFWEKNGLGQYNQVAFFFPWPRQVFYWLSKLNWVADMDQRSIRAAMRRRLSSTLTPSLEKTMKLDSTGFWLCNLKSDTSFSSLLPTAAELCYTKINKNSKPKTFSCIVQNYLNGARGNTYRQQTAERGWTDKRF